VSPNATLKRSFVTTLLVAALVMGGLGIGAAASVPGMQVGRWLALALFALLAAPLLYLLWRQWTRWRSHDAAHRRHRADLLDGTLRSPMCSPSSPALPPA
jgi:membrane protein implicated in regulation of membrane protease activity